MPFQQCTPFIIFLRNFRSHKNNICNVKCTFWGLFQIFSWEQCFIVLYFVWFGRLFQIICLLVITYLCPICLEWKIIYFFRLITSYLCSVKVTGLYRMSSVSKVAVWWTYFFHLSFSTIRFLTWKINLILSILWKSCSTVVYFWALWMFYIQ